MRINRLPFLMRHSAVTRNTSDPCGSRPSIMPWEHSSLYGTPVVWNGVRVCFAAIPHNRCAKIRRGSQVHSLFD